MFRTSADLAAALATATILVLGCVGNTTLRPPGPYRYFDAPALDDPWTPKIAAWQAREQAVAWGSREPAPASVSGGGSGGDAVRGPGLRAKYLAYRAQRKRALAREVAAWIQEQAVDHYRPDGPLDRWATLQETLDSNGDDCDGLELLTYHLLRDMGFREDEVFRSIVYRPEDGQHHMVTLWFERPEDPWVIDPTGAMTSGMPRMSEVPGWLPLKVFSETEEFSVRRQVPAPAARAAVVPGAGAR